MVAHLDRIRAAGTRRVKFHTTQALARQSTRLVKTTTPPGPWPISMRRSLSLPLRLAILVAGTILPLIGFAAAIVYQHYRQDQRDAFARVLQNTRSIQLVLDREMQGIVSGLTVLAGSDSLMRGDFESFRGRAKAFLAQFPDDPSIVIGDREGRQLFNSSRPPGEALPPRTVRGSRDEVFRTRKPVFS